MSARLCTRDGVEIEVGDWIVAGDTPEDREAGRYLGGGMVGWESGVQTAIEDGAECEVYTWREAALRRVAALDAAEVAS